MLKSPQFINDIFTINSDEEFNDLSLQIFHFQYANNQVYQSFVDALQVKSHAIRHYSQIPFMPIEFFKQHRVFCGKGNPEAAFQSSGTTGMQFSKHGVADLSLYKKSFLTAFEMFYGNPNQWRILALLPSYLEQGNSSLIYMANHLIKATADEASGFYLDEGDDLIGLLHDTSKKTLLLGVTYALLDLAEKTTINNKNLVVMETGGMKGRRKELVREELHKILKSGFNISSIHSEYGMTELLSQAYSKGDGLFESPPWLRILTRDTNDPLSLMTDQRTGGINIIDLANVYSCSFLATQDLGRVYRDNSFEILGRFDASDIRGCNLMVE